MASFSRHLGPQFLLLVRQQTAAGPCRCAAPPSPSHILLRLSRSQQLRLQPPSRFIQTATRSKPKHTSKRTPPPPPPKPAPKIIPFNPAAGRKGPPSFLAQLAARGRTTLYEAPSHFWYRTSSYGAAIFCISYTVYQYWETYTHPPSEGLAWWVPNAFFIICMFTASLGTYFAMGTLRIVRTIEAIPTAAEALPRALLGRPAAQRPPIYILVHTQRMIPFLPTKKVAYWPDEVRLPFRMTEAMARARPVPVSARDRLLAKQAEREANEKRAQYDREHLMTVPFRDGKRAAGSVWGQIQRSFSREGFATIELRSWKYKIDVTGGWALEDGRAMDRVLGVKQ
ncbi:hypothetical protein QBC39DRAFT_420789 [Podospora conica]|nr:hypothetical protein QBC39DRAFT_420789 [Schizothecium conicum]